MIALHIGAFAIGPDDTTAIYTKQHLHGGEERFFTPSFEDDPILPLGQERAALAICADIDHADHAVRARQAGATLYLAGIFFGQSGIEGAYRDLSASARANHLEVLMANYVGDVWNMRAGGASAFWNADGDLVAALDDRRPGLLLADTP